MYLWKYWRESRRVFGFALLQVAALFATAIRVDSFSVAISNSGSWHVSTHSGLIVAFFYLQILPLCFFAWLLGSFGIGRDLGEGSGSFLFSRPRRRSWFLWCDWGFGMSQIVLITVLANLAIWLMMRRLLMPTPGGYISFPTPAHQVLLSELMAISAAGGILIAGLIFSVTYASTVVMRHARGVMLSLGLFLCYLVVGAIVHHYWEAITFPSLLFQAFEYSGHSILGLNPYRYLEILVRGALILLFPIVAQLTLERTDL